MADDRVAALCNKLGFDPARQPTGDAKVLAGVIEEIQNERAAKVRTQLKELLTKAMDLRSQIDKAKKTFEKEVQKHEKELGKILADVERLANGKPAADDQPVEAEPAKE